VLTAIWLSPAGSSIVQYSTVQYSTHLQTNNTRDNKMKQDIQNGTYTKLRIIKLTKGYLSSYHQQMHLFIDI
jgi:hypothetical protein